MDVPERVPDFDLYAELEVSPTASVATIDAAWRSLVKRHHPDATLAEAGAAGSAERIRRLNIAHHWLTDAERRDRYDRERPLGQTMASTSGAEFVTRESSEGVAWAEVRDAARRHPSTSSSRRRSLMDSPILTIALGVLALLVAGSAIVLVSRFSTVERPIANTTVAPIPRATLTPRTAATPDAATALAASLPDEVAGITLVGDVETGAEVLAGSEAGVDELVDRTGGSPDDLVGAYKAGQAQDGRSVTVVGLAMASVAGSDLAVAFQETTTESAGVAWSPDELGGRSVTMSRDQTEPQVVAYLLSSTAAMYLVISSDVSLAEAAIRALP